MENYIPRGICKYFQVHSLMPFCPMRVIAPYMFIASLSQITRVAWTSTVCSIINVTSLILKLFPWPTIVTFPSPYTLAIHLAPAYNSTPRSFIGPDRASHSLPFRSVHNLSSSDSYLKSTLPSNWSSSTSNQPVQGCHNKLPKSLICLWYSWVFYCIKIHHILSTV